MGLLQPRRERRTATTSCDGQATCGRRVRGTVRCNMRALRRRLGDSRFPLHSFRRADYELPRELCQASHSREESARNDPICNMCALRYARTRGVSACHVSSSPSHSSGALIGNRRASYARQATRENGVRQVAPVYDSFRVKLNGPQPVTVTVACRHGTQTPLPDDPTRLLPVDPHSLGLGFSGPLDPLGARGSMPLKGLPPPPCVRPAPGGRHLRLEGGRTYITPRTEKATWQPQRRRPEPLKSTQISTQLFVVL